MPGFIYHCVFSGYQSVWHMDHGSICICGINDPEAIPSIVFSKYWLKFFRCNKILIKIHEKYFLLYNSQ